MPIHEIDISDRPVCPGCKQADRVERICVGLSNQPIAAGPSDLDRWWCDRCHSLLSALPVLPAVSGRKPEPRSHKRRKATGEE